MSAYLKDILREITGTMGRFASLLIITALGAASVVGIQATSIDMRDVADKTYKERKLYDVQLKSSVGFDDEDIAALRSVPGVNAVMPTYVYDTYVYFEKGTHTVRTYALTDELNKIELLEGRLPQNTGECAVEPDLLAEGGYEIGDKISLGLDNPEDYHKVFDRDVFTIVGVVSSPYYISVERGNTSLGDGKLSYYLYLSPDEYKLDVYTDAYVLMAESLDMYNLADDYSDAAETWVDLIKQTGNVIVQSKLDEYADAQQEIDDGWREYYDGIDELNEKIADGREELADAKRKLDEAADALEAGRTELDETRDALNESLKVLEETAPQGVSPELDAQYAQVYAALDILDEMQIEFDESWNDYSTGLEEYGDGLRELESEEADATAKLADAKIELEDAQEELNNAPEPELFYFTRKDGVAFESYYQDTLRLQKIGYVFPLVFFFVAILVSLTTMSRMVEERRTQIGIYKALGYGPVKIIIKYLIYAFGSGVSGGVLGVVTGSIVFPIIITDAYGHLYDMPPINTPIPPAIAVIAVVSAVGIVMLVTLITCLRSMSDSPAELMRPKSPPDGKRVLIEKIPFVWNRLDFIGKVTARNILRYKKRFVMTLIGVAGCSALLLTAFGLRDSVGGVADIQYEKILAYNSRAYIKEITSAEQRTGLDSLLFDSFLYIREESVDAKNNGGKVSASLIVPEIPGELSQYINLLSVKTGESIPFSQDSVFVTQKLARVLGVSEGGNLDITANDGSVYTVDVTGVVENYVLNYIYMSPDIYERLFGTEPLLNSILSVTNDAQRLATELLTNDNVRAVVNTSDIRENISVSTDALGIVTVVLIILACALALVVLFNLTNINITERIRELATIKVLGFYDSELAMYIYRENGIVTLMGIALGIAGGILLNDFVLTSAEIDLLMFPHIIKLQSYVLATVLSMVFAVFVNLVMNYRLAGIDMVESLKNVE